MKLIHQYCLLFNLCFFCCDMFELSSMKKGPFLAHFRTISRNAKNEHLIQKDIRHNKLSCAVPGLELVPKHK